MKKLIVALDGMTLVESLGLAAHLKDADALYGVKLGDLLLATGLDVVRKFKGLGVKVMVDNKWWDIPNTVANKVRREAESGADIITVSMMNQPEALEAARLAAPHTSLVGVTLLSSRTLDLTTDGQIFLSMCGLASRCHLNGVTVPSPFLGLTTKKPDGWNAPVRESLFRLTPGVRMMAKGEVKEDDQRNTGNGPPDAEFVVVGRPITKATDPVTAAKAYVAWLES